MKYEARLYAHIPDKSKVVIPISLDQNIQSEKVKSLLELAHRFETTIVIADTLQRHNIVLEEAINQGDAFLKKYHDFLKGLKVVRWNFWIESSLFEENKALIEKKCEENNEYKNAIKLTAKNVLSKKEDASVAYLKEENAVYLMWKNFEYVLYTRPITHALMATYENFPSICCPRYVQIHFAEIKNEKMLTQSMFDKRKEKSLPAELRFLLEYMEKLLRCSEISEKTKVLFVEQVKSLFFVCAEGNKNSDYEVNEQIILGCENKNY